MKIKLILLSVAALAFGRPAGLSTANTLTQDVNAVNERLAALEARNATLEADLAAARSGAGLTAAPVEEQTVLAMLCKGAGVDISDVRWRIQAGLEPDQAVIAAQAQKEFVESKK